jgi:hypothetical protein
MPMTGPILAFDESARTAMGQRQRMAKKARHMTAMVDTTRRARVLVGREDILFMLGVDVSCVVLDRGRLE